MDLNKDINKNNKVNNDIISELDNIHANDIIDRTTNPKTLLRMFPYLPNKSHASNLKIDTDALHYITVREYADKISTIIKTHIIKTRKNPYESVITDATACVGGDTIPFATKFKKVYAIELDKTRCEFLKNNISVYNLTNVEIINNNFLNVITKIEDQNVIYIDPPWGGRNYKVNKNLKLTMSNLPLEVICNNCFNSKLMKKEPDMVVLKLPTNYDIKHFYNTINSKEIYFYDLKKMYILVIINPKLHF